MPLSAMIGVLLLCAVGGIILIARYQTEMATREEARLAESAIHMLGEPLLAGATDYGRWDEALAAAADTFDYEWLSKNIGEAAEASFGTDLVFILDPGGKSLYSRIDKRNGVAPIATVMPAAFGEWLALWRQKPPYSVVSGTIPFGDRAAIFAIAPLRPFESSSTRAPTGHCLVFVKVIDSAIIRKLAANFRLDNLHILPAKSETPETFVRIPDARGNTALLLAWDPQRPGDDLGRPPLPVSVHWRALHPGHGDPQICHPVRPGHQRP